jgi:hypothetical protein
VYAKNIFNYLIAILLKIAGNWQKTTKIILALTLKKSSHARIPTRVTRLGEFLPTGRFFGALF